VTTALLSELGETGLLARIRARFDKQKHASLVLGPGDDAAVSRLSPGRVLVSTHDDLSEGAHFERRWTDFRRLARKLLRINLSDLAAMGAVEPVGVLCGAGFPKDAPESWAAEFLEGLAEDAKHFGVPVLGGNLAKSERLFFSMTALGQAKPGELLYRSGARAGELVYGVGPVGLAARGLAALKEGREDETAVAAFWEPEPRLKDSALLARKKLATALIDNSDGLRASCELIAAESGLKFVPELRFVPDGEDYGLVFSVPAKKEAMLKKTLPKAYRIGRLEKGKSAGATGYDHFR
jgi:thiamine-monophosphate kinase